MAIVDLRYPCVCCGRLTMAGPPGSYEICPVCCWEDDPVQLRWPDQAIGANPRTSLIEAQRNFEAFGASHEQFLGHVRPPEENEPRDRSWRPIDPERDRFEPRGVQLAAWPDDRTVLYWWRYRDPGFWRPPHDGPSS
ncbi:CPCC family cysteine-rich protein [Kitasatospora herbaricolor]|uniref:CPCC family cysteine-rich protein n=1 Tax=Kitasatospora herbaricolor TaxID=68217 RepID=A0ABZ1WKK4_9ACTN|nr:CPCC family cysteine-rich protein [Kitasatospora herbaricolor]